MFSVQRDVDSASRVRRGAYAMTARDYQIGHLLFPTSLQAGYNVKAPAGKAQVFIITLRLYYKLKRKI